MVFYQIWSKNASFVKTGSILRLFVTNDINSETLNNLYETPSHAALIVSNYRLIYDLLFYLLFPVITFSQKQEKYQRIK